MDSNSSQYSDAQDTLSSEEDDIDPEPLESLDDDALFAPDSLDNPTTKAMRQPLSEGNDVALLVSEAYTPPPHTHTHTHTHTQYHKSVENHVKHWSTSLKSLSKGRAIVVSGIDSCLL